MLIFIRRRFYGYIYFYCYRNVMKGPPNDPGAPFQGQGTHTLPHQHHYQKHQQQQHATLPRASVIQDINTQTQVSNFNFIFCLTT